MQEQAKRTRVVRLLMLGLLLLLMLQSALSQNQGLAGNSDMESLLSAIEGSSIEDSSHPYHSLIPTTPSPENINCYVEIVPPMRVGGVCKRMGASRRRGRHNGRRVATTWACQAGVHLEIGSPHCGNGARSRRSRQRRGRN